MCAQAHTEQDATYAREHVAKAYESVVRRAAACSAAGREGMRSTLGHRRRRRLLEVESVFHEPHRRQEKAFSKKEDFTMRNFYLARGLPVPVPIHPPPQPPVRHPPDLNRLLARQQKAYKGVPALQQQSRMDVGERKSISAEFTTSLEEVHSSGKRITTDVAGMLAEQQKPYAEAKEMQRSGMPFRRGADGSLARVKAKGSKMHVTLETAVPEAARTVTAPPNPWSGQPVARVVSPRPSGVVGVLVGVLGLSWGEG
jgi:hypothetical protein